MPVPRRSGDGRRVLLVGASGFIGSAIARVLRQEGLETTFLLRREPEDGSQQATVLADLSDVASLARACKGKDVVINAASYVGSDSRKQHDVNAIGAANLAVASERTGVSRLVYVSSTSVYGGAFVNGSSEHSSGRVQRSTLSASRAMAEQATLGAGGVVLRPHLVYGRGDRFFLGPLLKAMIDLGGWIEEGRARVSTISRESLAFAVTRVAMSSVQSIEQSRVFHAAHPAPATISQMVERVTRSTALMIPSRSFSARHALGMLSKAGVTQSQIDMVAHDNWVDSTSLWRALGTSPGVPIDISSSDAEWYWRSLRQSSG